MMPLICIEFKNTVLINSVYLYSKFARKKCDFFQLVDFIVILIQPTLDSISCCT